MIWRQLDWRHLAFLNYEISPEKLREVIPAGLEPDDCDGESFVTLVGCLAKKSRLLSSTTTTTASVCVQLRAYVKRKVKGETRRGILLLGEIADQGENARHDIHFEEGGVDHFGRPYSNGVAAYEWKVAGEWRGLRLKTNGLPQPSGFSMIEHSIMQRKWWYEKTRLGVMEFSLSHPDWFYWDANEAGAETDLAELRQREWAHIFQNKPTLAFLAKGSQVVLGLPRRL